MMKKHGEVILVLTSMMLSVQYGIGFQQRTTTTTTKATRTTTTIPGSYHHHQQQQHPFRHRISFPVSAAQSWKGSTIPTTTTTTTTLRAEVTNDDDDDNNKNNIRRDESSSSSTPSNTAGTTKPATTGVVTVERIMKDNYPEFYRLLIQNENIFQKLEEDFSERGYTIFAPNPKAFGELTEKQKQQLKDPRNSETVQKMGLYHIVPNEAISYTQLNREDWTVPKTSEGLPALKFGSLVTMGGEVPIERTKKKRAGSLLRSILFPEKKKTVRDKDGKPITEIVVGAQGTIIRSVKVGNAIIHEVDGFVSPTLLWRYFDQLRLPGL